MASMNGIDIAGYQAGIDLTKVPCDFVIIKSTQGKSYVNPDFDRAIRQAVSAAKCTGIYHYIDGTGGYQAEMDHFINKWGPYKGTSIPCLDWEGIQNSQWGNEGYLESCIRYFIEKTGIPPIVYASQSAFPWSLCSKYNCGTWVAQYANNNQTGYQVTPWNEGKYTCTIRQYSSAGKLANYSGSLDLDKAYIDAAAWRRYANPDGGVVVVPPATSTPSSSGIAVDGLWGTATTSAVQSALGTPVDGIVSNQSATDLAKCNKGGLLTSSWKTGTGGSPMVKALQSKVGAKADGYVGTETISKLQTYLGTPVDGLVSNPSVMVKELQSRLNSGKF